MSRMTAPELPGLTYLEHLGSGGYAEVYLYEQHRPKLKVAVKVLNADDLDADVERQFTDEANTMARFDHPYIVPVMRADLTADGRPYIVMKYYPKANLSVRARREQFSVADVLKLGIQISSAVETAHRAEILHRDIKPANVLTGAYDDPGLTDFGIAAATTSEATTTAEGMSVPWSAPEVLYGLTDGDVRSDVYSLGATLWHLLSGRSPYEVPGGDNGPLALMRRIQNEPVPAVRRADVPESLQRLLRQALAKKPDGRPQTAMALALGLQAIEQELHFGRTNIVVPEEEVAVALARDVAADADATNVRSARVVQAQSLPAAPPAPSTPPPLTSPPMDDDAPTTSRARQVRVTEPEPAPPAPRTGPRERSAPPAPPPAAATVRRARQVAPEPVEPSPPLGTPEPPARGKRGKLLAGVTVVVLLILAVGVALALSKGGSADPGRDPVAGEQPDARGPGAAAADGSAPGAPNVAAVRADATSVVLTWTYEDPRPGDVFRYRVLAPGGAPASTVEVQVPTVTLPLSAPTDVEVEVVRAATGLLSPATKVTTP